MTHNFRKLKVWIKAKEVAKLVYVLTRQLPDDERFGLTSQMRRCAISIPSNIAEGSKRSTQKDFKQFLNIAAGSAAELETQLILMEELYTVPTEELVREVDELQRMLFSFVP